MDGEWELIKKPAYNKTLNYLAEKYRRLHYLRQLRDLSYQYQEKTNYQFMGLENNTQQPLLETNNDGELVKLARSLETTYKKYSHLFTNCFCC